MAAPGSILAQVPGDWPAHAAAGSSAVLAQTGSAGAAGAVGGAVFWVAVVLVVLTAASLGAAVMSVVLTRRAGARAGETGGAGGEHGAPAGAGLESDPSALRQAEAAAAIEGRLVELRALVRQADESALRLEGLVEAAELAGAGDEPSPAPGAGACGDLEEVLEVPAAAANLEPKVRPADHSGESADLSHLIYQLADDGLSPVQIAQHLHQHTGKVELILALRNL